MAEDGSQLVVINLQWLATMLLIFKSPISVAKLLEPLLYCTFVISSWAKCVVDVVNCLCGFMTHFKFEQENCLNLLFIYSLK